MAKNAVCLFIIFLGSLFPSGSLHAQLNNWIGPASGDWGMAGNWSQGSVPDATDSVIIFNAAVTISSGTHTIRNIYAQAAALTALTIQNGATLQVTNATGQGDVAIFYNLTNHGQIQVTVNPGHNGLTFSAAGNNMNTSIINLVNGEGALLANSFINYGTLNVLDMTPQLTGALRNTGNLINDGIITVNGSSGTSADGLTNQDTISNMGDIMISNINGDQAHGLHNEVMTLGSITTKPHIHNKGKLIISSILGTNSDGLFNQNSILNDSLIQIEDITAGNNYHQVGDSTEIINNGCLTVDNVNGYFASGLYIESNTCLVNGQTGVIKINDLANASGGVGYGLFSTGLVHNIGVVQIIDQTERIGISNNGRFLNDSLVRFSNPAGNSCFQNLGYFENGLKGLITSSKSTGITIMQNLDSLINRGTFKIDSFNTTTGIDNGGYMLNYSIIQICDQEAGFSTGLRNESTGKFENTLNGLICLEKINDGVGLSNQGEFINQGSVKALDLTSTSSVIGSSNGVFSNFNIINIDRANGTGINISTSHFVNGVNGVILVDSISKQVSNQPRGLETNNATMVNEGSILITNHQDGYALRTSGTGSLTNMGSILINQVTFNQDAVFIGALLDNQGYFKLTNVSKDAIFINDTLINQDSLIIAHTNGPGIENSKVLINQSSGVIKISNTIGTFSNGLFNAERDVVENKGRILISQVNWNGIENRGLFTNMNGGYIEVTDVVNASFDAFENDSTFINEACASLILFGKLESRYSVDNEGYIYQDHSSNFFSTGSTFDHKGVYVDVQGASESETEFQNNGIYIKEIPGNLNCIDTIFNFFTGTNVNNITATVISTDEAGGMVAGAVDMGQREIHLGLASGGASDLFIQFDYGVSCVLPARIPFANEITCSNFMVWTGAISNNWSNPGNWSLNRLPDMTDEIFIPSGSTVDILVGFTGEARLIDVAHGAELNVEGVLSVIAGMP